MSATPFDGSALVDEQSLPGWLSNRNETEPLPLPFTVSDSIGTGKAKGERGNTGEAGQRASAGASRGTDEEALPEWLRQVYADAQVPSLSGTQPPAPPEKSKLSGSDLVDVRAVPKWLQEASQTSPLPDFPAEALWASLPPSALPPARPQQPSGSAWPGVSLSAGSGDTSSSPPPPGADGFSGRMLIDEEALPEWLRQGDTGLPPRGAVSSSPAEAKQRIEPPLGSASGIFSAAELVDTQSLPAWMKAEGSAAEPGKTSAPVGQDGPSGSASGIFSAAELVDTQSLPAWMRSEAPPAGQAKQSALSASGSASGIFSAAELVDTQSLPAWLRTGETASGTDRASQPGSASGPAGSASGIFSAAELVDTQSLPAWLRSEASAAPPASSTPAAPGASGGFARGNTSKIAAIPTGFSSQQTGGFSAAELVDTHSLPAWLKGAVGDPGASQAGQQSQARAAGSQMSAAELVDTQSLPAWMKEAGQAGPTAASGQTGEFSAASLVDPEALPPWLRAAEGGEPLAQPAQRAGQSGAPAEMGRAAPEPSSFSAASLIDQEQLPEWLRNPQRPGAPGAGMEQEEGPHAHVPRRPRQPVEPNRAPSQAAANVFSSVLGPTAGEGQPQGRRAPAQREMTPAERGGAPWPGSGPGQAGEWGGPDAGTRSQPPRPPSKPQQGRFEGEPGRGFDQRAGARNEWQDAFDEMPDAQGAGPEGRRPGGRQSGQMSPSQRSWQQETSGEWGAPQDQPGGWQGGMGMPADSLGQAGAGLPPRFDEGEFAAPPPQQRRGKQPTPVYEEEADGWEGIPEYGAGAAGDDEVGPPSGVFAKIKRVLGFGR